MKCSIRSAVLTLLLMLPFCASAQTWDPIGPYGGPGRGIAIDSGGAIYAGFHKRYGGVFRSTDQGGTWTSLSSMLDSRPGELAVGPDGTLFAGDMPGLSRFYRSTDDGENWTGSVLPDLLQTTSINVAPDGTLYFGFLSKQGGYTMLMSGTSGDSWTTVSPGLGEEPLNVAFDEEGGVWLVTMETIFISPGGDNIWQQLYESDVYPFRDIATLPDGSVCALRQDAVIRSVDDGQSWEVVLTSSRNLIGMGTNRFGQIVAYTADGMLYLSDDNGSVWIDSLQIRFDLNECISVEKDVFWLSGSPGGVYRMDFSAKTFSAPVTGIDRLVFTTVEQFGDRLIAGGVEGNLYIGNPDDRSWREILLPEADPVTALLVVDEFTILAGLFGGGLYRSGDGGESWYQVAEDQTGLGSVTSLAQDFSGNQYAGTEASGVYISHDGGDNWTLAGLGGLGVWSMGVTGHGRILFGGSGGWYSAQDGTGVLKKIRIPSVTSDIQALAATEDDVIYAGTWSDGLYRSVDDGVSWEYLGFADTVVDDIHTSGRDTIHLGTYYGYYLSADGGTTWQRRTGGMFRDDGYVQELAFTPFGTFAATAYGLYGADVLTSTQNVIVENMPGDELQILAGGTNDPVEIRLRIQSPGSASLDLYDMLGRHVAHIEHGRFSEGAHRTEYDASTLPGGRYFVVLKTDDGMTVGDLLIVK